MKGFRPAPLIVGTSERWRAIVGALLGIVITAILCRLCADTTAVWLVAPLGASAVLVFAVPASPLAQPWSVVGGNTVSALMGVLCVHLIDDPALAAGVAVAAAIVAMFALRCLHPPGGAAALLAVLTHASSLDFVFFPVLVNSVLLVLVGIIYNTATGRRYPHSQLVERTNVPTSRFSSADLDAVLKRYNQVLDVSRDELEDILHMAEMNAMERRMSELRCEDIMTRDVFTVEYGTDLQDAWELMRRHRVKALPVVDRQRRIIGIISLADFMRHAEVDRSDGMRERLNLLIKRSGNSHTTKPEAVGQIMCHKVRVISANRSVGELMSIFSEHGHHHIPVIDGNHRLAGIITQSDFVRALYRSGGVRP
ncbi:HPP family protein [Steroidobacter flavus]|uniref:HPP family protein n=1 Tax=Steroidobacter flavus TaxID=1842136 RepID=A0ABV8T2B2_9GAMM